MDLAAEVEGRGFRGGFERQIGTLPALDGFDFGGSNRLLVAGIVAVILLVRALPPVWRALIDAGVALALAWGTAVMIVYFVRGLAGPPIPIGPDLPGEDVAQRARPAESNGPAVIP